MNTQCRSLLVVLCLLTAVAGSTFSAKAAKPAPTPPPPPAFDNQVISYGMIWGGGVMNADGSKPLTVIDLNGQTISTIGRPSWSPDGKRVAFVAHIDSFGGAGLYVHDLTTHALTLVTPLLEPRGGAAWSPQPGPDGRYKIAFNDDPTSEFPHNLYDLYIINEDGTGLTRLTNTPLDNEHGLAWSPDGSMIMVTAAQYTWDGERRVQMGKQLRMHALGLDAAGTVVITDTLDALAGTGHTWFAANPDGSLTRNFESSVGSWSRAGDQIVIRHINEMTGKWSLYTVDLVTSAVTPLTEHLPGGQGSPCWSPDDSKILFMGEDMPGLVKKGNRITSGTVFLDAFTIGADGLKQVTIGRSDIRGLEWWRGDPATR